MWIARVQVFDVPPDAIPLCIPCALNDPQARAFMEPSMLEVLTREYAP